MVSVVLLKVSIFMLKLKRNFAFPGTVSELKISIECSETVFNFSFCSPHPKALFSPEPTFFRRTKGHCLENFVAKIFSLFALLIILSVTAVPAFYLLCFIRLHRTKATGIYPDSAELD